MSKHRLEDAEEVEAATLPRKKSKKEKKDKKDRKDRKEKLRDLESATSTPLDSALETPVSEVDGEVKTKKKDKKDKKEKKDKKKAKKNEAETNGEQTSTDEVNGEKIAKQDTAEVISEAPSRDEVDTDRKSKKGKKDKKDKKKRKAEDAYTNGASNGNGNTSGEASKATNGTANGSTPSNTPQTYEQTSALSALPEADIASFLSKHQITVNDPLSPRPLRPIIEFSHLPSSSLVAKNPFASFKAPTPIQAASWPFGLSGRDIVGVAETGSGKTIAFGLPLISAVLGMPKSKGAGRIRAVVVSPTRELAMQTNEQLAKLGELVGLKTVCVYGGAPKDEQRVLLRKADVIVATPGRLKDFLEEGSIKLEGAKFVVLDEADRMLDKGFEDDIKRIIGCTPRKDERQTLMFTATWPQSVQALASTFMVSPVKIQIGGNESGDLQANARIEQRVEVVDPRGKEARLLQLLKAQPRNERVLVFCLYKKEATRVEGFLQQRGIKVVGIHGDLRQEQRTRSLEAFKTGQTPVLVATDVAARGLDIPEVKLVVNVTFPLTIEDYVHRIGRTGRAGKTGHAITLFTEHDKSHSGELINILKQAGQPVPEDLLKFGTTVKKKAHGTYGAFFKDVDMNQKGTKITFDD
ncbi:DEAD-domain-containing protein [Annulohypoxylon truncatum]|uniref:DEAD-domain-containing protein n=1 Tax=Annulohypoxylon truncatum TaxID=327061 RepID=UPI0020088613|nr:DEAD-domain-containing protein [Annulohypoxylon truncatum]KAI1204414.1 DEAD-domain-containing protein [Annulohypoxylon truncatum]